MSRPDEREHIEITRDFREACALAREMSDRYDGSSVVCALDERPDGGKQATGHIEFTFGLVAEKVGTLEFVDVPLASEPRTPAASPQKDSPAA